MTNLPPGRNAAPGRTARLPADAVLAGQKSRGESGFTLRLMSYNIQTGIASKRYSQYLTQSWKHILPYRERRLNLDRIAALVSHFDLVGLQEVDAGSLRSDFTNQIAYLSERSGLAYWYHQTNRRLGRLAQHSLGLLSRFPFVEVREHALPGAIPGRGAIIARFGSESGPLTLIIIHLALSRRARLKQAAYIGDIAAESDPAIIMGDLNCGFASLEMDILIRQGRLRIPDPGPLTYPSWKPKKGIDHILVSPKLSLKEIKALKYPYSDHLPIAASVRLPPDFDIASLATARGRSDWPSP